MPPPPPAQHKKKSDLEAYLISTFNKVEDQYGQKLDILPALPTLVEVLSGTPNANFAEKVSKEKHAIANILLSLLIHSQKEI
jgi:hypothetical protein